MSSTQLRLIGSGVVMSSLSGLVAFLICRIPFPPFTVDQQHPIDPLAIALVIGLLVRHSPLYADKYRLGIKWCSAQLLAIAIALLGVKLNFFSVLSLSSQSLWVSISCVLIALTLTQVIAHKLLNVPQGLAQLIAIGTSICGGTAIAVTSSTIKARDEEIAMSISCVTLCGLLCVFVLPPLGHLFAFTPDEFGVWSGVVVHATPQVLATAFAFDPLSGDPALIVKLTRVLFLVPLLLFLRLKYARLHRESSDLDPISWRSLLPPFMIVFVVLALLNTYEFLPETLPLVEWKLSTTASILSKSFMIIAMAAIGLLVDLKRFKALGFPPLISGLIATLLMVTIGGVLVKLKSLSS